MSKTWFKFYGLEYLSDPKMLSLTPIEKALWLTILCLAASSDVEGQIKYITEDKIMMMTGISPLEDDWKKNIGFMQRFRDLGMITRNLVEDVIYVKNYSKRQETNLSDAERSKRYRDSHKSDSRHAPSRDDSHAREEKNREEKKEVKKEKTPSLEPSKGKQEKPEQSMSFLESIPEGDIAALCKEYAATPEQIRKKGRDLVNYCKAKGKVYRDYRAFLSNALDRDFGVRKPGTWSYT